MVDRGGGAVRAMYTRFGIAKTRGGPTAKPLGGPLPLQVHHFFRMGHNQQFSGGKHLFLGHKATTLKVDQHQKYASSWRLRSPPSAPPAPKTVGDGANTTQDGRRRRIDAWWTLPKSRHSMYKCASIVCVCVGKF